MSVARVMDARPRKADALVVALVAFNGVRFRLENLGG
jgi:hypothetical protein